MSLYEVIGYEACLDGVDKEAGKRLSATVAAEWYSGWLMASVHQIDVKCRAQREARRTDEIKAKSVMPYVRP